MSDNTPVTPSKKRPRRRSTVSVLKAAKAAGCASVEFSDGTVVKLTADDVAIDDAANNEVDRWFSTHAD